MARIGLLGFHHESNSFASLTASWDRFVAADSYPALMQGADILTGLRGSPFAAAGMAQRLGDIGEEIVPLVWAGTSPSGPVTDAAVAQYWDLLEPALKAAGPLDAVLCDFHGAAVAESEGDVEGLLLERIRGIVGADIPVAISLDLHANVTSRMVRHATIVEGYRTYPHVDMKATGIRTADAVLRCLMDDGSWSIRFRKLDRLIPIANQCTLIEPAKTLYSRLKSSGGSTLVPTLTMGFPLADTAECGPAVIVSGRDADRVEALADELFEDLNDAQQRFFAPTFTPGQALNEAESHLKGRGTGPVILADIQDNPGGGGSGDTVGLLAAMVTGGIEDGALGLLIDPDAAALAHEAGEGEELSLTLGGRSGGPGADRPLALRATVLQLGDGEVTGTGPVFGGAAMSLGPMARLGLGGVEVVVASKPVQAADQAMFKHVGLDPAEKSILALKSSVHFRADFDPIARATLLVISQGSVPHNLSTLDFKNLRSGVTI